MNAYFLKQSNFIAHKHCHDGCNAFYFFNFYHTAQKKFLKKIKKP